MSGGGPANTVLYDANGNPLGSSALVSNVEQQGYGSSSQVWVSGGPGVLPAWGAVPGGASGTTLIATVTASASASVNFDNQLTATYDNYLVVFENLVGASNNTAFYMDVGTGGTPTYSSTTYGTCCFGSTSTNSGSSSGVSGVATSATIVGPTGTGSNNTLCVSSTSTNALGGSIVVGNTQNASNYKSIVACVGGNGVNGSSGSNVFGSQINGCGWQTATALTSLRFKMSSGNITTCIAKLYGYKN